MRFEHKVYFFCHGKLHVPPAFWDPWTYVDCLQFYFFTVKYCKSQVYWQMKMAELADKPAAEILGVMSQGYPTCIMWSTCGP
jgi:hypothetical protein